MNLFKKFPFQDSPNTAVVTGVHVLDEKKPILYVSHDDDDGCWQFLCGDEHNIEDSRVISLQEIYEIDKSIKDVARLEYGKCAYRKDENSKWIFQ